MFHPGETVSHVFNIPFIPHSVAKVLVTYKQRDHVILAKTITSSNLTPIYNERHEYNNAATNETTTNNAGEGNELIQHKKEIAPYEGVDTLGSVRVGDIITYEIDYENYKSSSATVTVNDVLDQYVELVADGTTENYTFDDTTNTVSWTIADVEAGASGTITIKVKVLDGVLASDNGPGKVVNGGETTTVQVGSDDASTVDTVENPIEEPIGSQLTVTLTQEESLVFAEKSIFSVQLNVITTGGARSASNEMEGKTGAQHFKEVISDV